MKRLRGLLGRPDEPPPVPEAVTVLPIGVVRSSLRDRRYRDTSEQAATLHLREELAPALEGLAGFSHAIVLTWLDQVDESERATLRERPGGIATLPELGVLALRTHHRPNPIGVTVVRVERVDGSSVRVIGLDAIDGTPVLDIKPYLPPYDSIPDATMPRWATGDGS